MAVIDHGNIASVRGQTVVINKVLRNTYALLSATLLFSALTALLSMSANISINPFVTLIVYFGMLFATVKLRNSAWGLAAIFALTGFLGFTLGPILNVAIGAYSNGGELVFTALAATGTIFLVLSGYVLRSGKDFSGLGKMLMVGILTAFVVSLIGLFVNIPALSLAVSGVFVLLMSGLILYKTSEIVHGGETNYIMATLDLYIAVYNLFLSLLHLLMAFAGNKE